MDCIIKVKVPRTWQSEEDIVLRRYMILEIAKRFIIMAGKTLDLNEVLKLSKKIEVILYAHSLSKLEYENHNTLNDRLILLSKHIIENNL